MNDAHLDDELLSATLDGDADPRVAGHLAACDACLARLDALDTVRVRLAAPPPDAPEALVERAMAAAVAAWRDEQGRTPAAGATVTPLRPAGSGPVHRRRVPERAARSRPRVPAWVLGAAAAVVAVALAVPVLTGGDDEAARTASAPTGEAADTAALDGAALDGGDLGSLTDQGTLRDALRASVPGATAADLAFGTEGAAPTAADEAPAASAPTTAADQPARSALTAAAPAAMASTAPCRAEVRSQFGQGLGDLLYTALLRWQGTDAVLLAYGLADTSGGGPDFRAFVMARDGCRLLVVQGF